MRVCGKLVAVKEPWEEKGRGQVTGRMLLVLIPSSLQFTEPGSKTLTNKIRAKNTNVLRRAINICVVPFPCFTKGFHWHCLNGNFNQRANKVGN